MAVKTGNLKIESGRETAAKLIEAAKEIFSTKGYEATTTEEIVKYAGVTRGALYHHYKGKQDLFEVVFFKAYKDVVERIKSSRDAAKDPWEALLAIFYEFLNASVDPAIQKILMVEGPAVMGWKKWHEVDVRLGMKVLIDQISMLVDNGTIRYVPIDALAYIISGAANECALWILQSDNPKRSLAEAKAVTEELLGSLLKNTPEYKNVLK